MSATPNESDSDGCNIQLADPSSPPESHHASTVEDEYKPASCMQQTLALVHKNLLNKIRTPVSFFFELFAPALFMWVLVLGYSLSEERSVSSSIYSNWKFDLADELLGTQLLGFLGINRNLEGILNNSSASTGQRRTLSQQKMDKLNSIFNADYDESENDASHLYSQDRFDWNDLNRLSRMLQDQNPDGGEVYYDDDIEDYEVIADSFKDFRKQLNRFLNSPMPIPTIKQYLTLSQNLSSAFNPNDLDEIYQSSEYLRKWGNLLTLGTMHLSPKGQITTDFVKYLQQTHDVYNITSNIILEDRPNATSVLIRIHDDVNSATEFVMNNLDERTFAVIDFDEGENDFKYTVRMNSTSLPNTNEITRWVSIGLNENFHRYYLSGHITIQRTVNEFAISRRHSSLFGSGLSQEEQCSLPSTTAWDVFTLPMPTPAYKQNPFFTTIGYLLGLTIAMAFLYPVSRLIKAIVEEKETRMKETLSILGVRPLAQWLSWIITASISSTIVAVTVSFTLSFFVMKNSSAVYLLIFILFFSAATTGFSFFIAAFFSRANLAAIVGPVALFVTLLPRWIFFGTNRYEAAASKMWASLLPCTAFAFGADILSDYEYAQVGLQSSNVGEGAYSFKTSLGFLLIDSILYFVLGWYLENVIPRQYGVAKKWYFPFIPTFWREVCPFSCRKKHSLLTEENGEISGYDDQIEEGIVEGTNNEAKLRIQNLIKIYNPKKAPAVNGLNVSMYDSEITCLLGHNGAGKSTTISILTGLYPPTSGDCIIYGKSVVHDMAECRQSMGICPQQNVLFNNLTVLEHIRFFERIKGISSDRLEDRTEEIGLADFTHTKAGALSGGNKRKLQLAIALAGDPKLVLLDEPTSGMDVYSRRATWELLRQKRHGRIILLTTHFMDEAEVLADRIAILKEGTLQCCGSALFLKQRFGLGYNITIVTDKNQTVLNHQGLDIQNKRNPTGIDEGNETNDNTPNSKTQEKVGVFLKNHIPGSRFIRESARELVFRFPPESETKFPELFDGLEKEAGFLGVTSYGVCDTSLEEVFLELAEEENDNKAILDENVSDNVPLPDHSKSEYKYLSRLSQIILLLHKRYVVQKRDIKGLFFKIVLPVLIIMAVLLVLLIDVPIEGSPIELTPQLFDTSGTGSSIGNNLIVTGSDFNISEQFISTLDGTYESVMLTSLRNLQTSQNVSEYLLNGSEGGEREFNFGSFIFGDIIKMILNINSTQIQELILPIIFQQEIDILDNITDTSAFLVALDEVLQDPNDFNIILDFVNQTETLFNFSFPDEFLQSLNDTIIDPNFNQTALELILSSIDIDQVEDEILNNLFNETEEIVIEGEGWIVSLTEEQIRSLSDSDNVTFHLNVEVPVSIMHNTSSSHSVAVFAQTYYDFLYKKCSVFSGSDLVAVNSPLPLTEQQSTEVRTILSIIASILLAIPFNYIPAAFAVFVVKERSCKSKHLQLVSGVDMLAYWLSTYIWDMILYFVLTILGMLGFLCFGEVSAVFTGTILSFLCTWSMMIGYGLSSLPFAYLLSRFFDSPPNAQISIMIIFFITGFVAVNSQLILSNLETTKDLAKTLEPLFRTWPAYNLGDGFLNLSSNFWETQIFDESRSPFRWEVCGRQLALLYGLSFPYFCWLMLLEYSSDGGSGGLFGRLLRLLRLTVHNAHNQLSGFKRVNADDIDEDVLEEEIRVNRDKHTLKAESPILIAELWKTYPAGNFISALLRQIASKICCCVKWKPDYPKVAVKNLSIHVENGETLGLLGINGAGKTTTMGILTGDITPTSGDAWIANHDVTGGESDGVRMSRQNCGFCPQTDPLLDLMTGRETLTMFGKLRGMPKDSLVRY